MIKVVEKWLCQPQPTWKIISAWPTLYENYLVLLTNASRCAKCQGIRRHDVRHDFIRNSMCWNVISCHFHIHRIVLKQRMHTSPHFTMQCIKIQSIHNIIYHTGNSYANKSTLKMRSSEDCIVKIALILLTGILIHKLWHLQH